jgi:hypothetical protein
MYIITEDTGPQVRNSVTPSPLPSLLRRYLMLSYTVLVYRVTSVGSERIFEPKILKRLKLRF